MIESNVNLQKPPFLSSNKRLELSDEELDDFYNDLRNYHLQLPYDKEKVAQEERNFIRRAVLTWPYAKLKRTIILHSERLPDNKSMIYTANHTGSFDQIYISLAMGKVPLHYLISTKVTSWPIRWNLVYKPSGVIVVDPMSVSSWQKAKVKLIQYLVHGKDVIVFPEGSRRGENNIGEFSSGIAQVAQESGSRICTFALKNTSTLLSYRPIVCVGETVWVGIRDNIKEATTRVKSAVVSAYNEILEYEKNGLKK